MSAISIEWGSDRHKLIIVTYLGNYTWNELDATVTEAEVMLQSVQHNVDMIVVLNPKIRPPMGGDMMPRIRHILTEMPANLRFLITVGRGNPFTHLLVNSILQVFPSRHKIRAAATEADALKLIADYEARFSSNR